MEVYATLGRAPITRLVGWSTQSRILASWTIRCSSNLPRDNGGSEIGDINGVFVEWAPLNNAPEDIPYLLSRLDEYGGPASYPIIWTVLVRQAE
jgi:hypothetical protein